MTEAVVCVCIVAVPLHAQIPTRHPNFWSTQRTHLGVGFYVSFQGLMILMLCAASPPARETLPHSLLCCGDPGVWCYCLSVALSVFITFILSFCYGNEIVSLVLMVVV